MVISLCTLQKSDATFFISKRRTPRVGVRDPRKLWADGIVPVGTSGEKLALWDIYTWSSVLQLKPDKNWTYNTIPYIFFS